MGRVAFILDTWVKLLVAALVAGGLYSYCGAGLGAAAGCPGGMVGTQQDSAGEGRAVLFANFCSFSRPLLFQQLHSSGVFW